MTGTVTKLDRRALVPGSVVDVQLQDVSRADAVADVLGTSEVTPAGEQVPIPFEVSNDPAAIDDTHRYAVRATIEVDGRLAYTSTEHVAVITNGAPNDDVVVTVSPVG